MHIIPECHTMGTKGLMVLVIILRLFIASYKL